jgi:hypothetical protein
MGFMEFLWVINPGWIVHHLKWFVKISLLFPVFGCRRIPLCFYLCLAAAALLSRLGKGLTIVVVYLEKCIAPTIISPLECRLDGSAGHPCPVKQKKGGFHYRTLHGGIPRLPARVP